MLAIFSNCFCVLNTNNSEIRYTKNMYFPDVHTLLTLYVYATVGT